MRAGPFPISIVNEKLLNYRQVMRGINSFNVFEIKENVVYTTAVVFKWFSSYYSFEIITAYDKKYLTPDLILELLFNSCFDWFLLSQGKQ